MDALATQTGLELEHVFDYEARMRPPVAIGRGAYGERIYWEALGGTVSGPRLRGEVLTGGGDWALTDGDGWTRLDVRGQCRTYDGAILYFTYRGVVEPTSPLLRAVATGGETGFEDQYFRAGIEVETGDPRYAWLTRSVLVARGRVVPGPGVAYQVFRVG